MKSRTFDMNLLKVLNVLFEERSVTRTGDRLGRTQSAVSNSLKNLRDAMNDPLLVRGPEGLVLTPRAQVLEAQVREIIRMTESCLADSAEFDPSTASGRFRIGAPDRLSLPVMLPLFATLRARAPDIAVDLITTDREQALALLDRDQLDLAVGWFGRPSAHFNASLLFQERFVCLCRDGHPILRIEPAVDLATILSFPHLVVSAAADRKAAFDIMLERFGQRRHAAISVSNFSMVPSLLRDSDLIGIYTARVADVLARDFGLATKGMPAEIGPLDHYMVWHNRYNADRKHGWFREQVAAACRRQ